MYSKSAASNWLYVQCRRGLSALKFGFCTTCVLLIHMLGITPAVAQTPHSVARTCGYAGGPTCPAPLPIVTQWMYEVDAFYGTNPPDATFHSFSDINAWYNSFFTNGGWCTTSNIGITEGENEWGPVPVYQYGIYVEDSYGFQYADTAYSSQEGQYAPCSQSWTSGAYVRKYRQLVCPPPNTGIKAQTPPYCDVAGSSGGELNSLKSIGPVCPRGCASGSTSRESGAAGAGSGKTVTRDPVDVSDGNNYVSSTDYRGGGDSPLDFTRSYNSLSAYTQRNQGSQDYYLTALGYGWTATYFQYLLPVTLAEGSTTYGTVYVCRPSGRVLIFNLYNGVYSPDGDVDASLVKTSSGWQYQSADGTIETYDASGKLLSVARRGEAPVTVQYASGSEAGDPPLSVSDAFGHTLKFFYTVVSTNGPLRLTKIVEPDGGTVQYAYTNGNLTSVTFPDGTKRTYGYGANFGDALVSITDESGQPYESWVYDDYGQQIVSAQRAGGVDDYSFSYSLSGSSGTVTVTDPLGETRTFGQQLIWGTYRTTSTSGPCSNCGYDASRTYDADGNITSRTDFNGNTTVYSYDPETNLEVSRTEAYGTAQARTVTTRWDSSWRLPDLITEPGQTIAYTYDSMGNVLTKTITDTTTGAVRAWAYTYDGFGRRLSAQGPRDGITSYTYYTCTTGYQCGELYTVTNALDQVTTYDSYDADGRPLTITGPNGTVTTLAYDARGRLTSRTVGNETTTFSYYPTGLLDQVTLPDGSSLAYTYDAAHRLIQISDGLGNKIEYTLDAMGNRVAVNTYDPSGTLHRTHTRVINALNEVAEDINAAGTSAVTTTYGYDSNGNRTSIDAPLSRNTTETYDALNRVKSITDPAGGVSTFGYDAQNDLISVTDPRGLTTSYGYDGFGDLVSQSSPDTGASTDTYDAAGNLATATDARGAVATYGYDALNRVTSIAYSLGGTTDQTLAFTYDQGTDGIGHLTGASDSLFSTSWSYDALGERTGMSQTVGGVTRSVAYGYTNGDLTSLTTPSGQSVTYGYNAAHEVTSVAVNGTTILSNVSYEPFGPANGWTWGNGSAFSRTFNGDGLITGISAPGSTESLSYDDANRISGITNTAAGASSWTYGYDALDRLTSATSSTVTDGWTYDADGNRLSQTGTSASTYSIPSGSNQITGITGALSRSYSYDVAGNTLSDSADTVTYDAAGRLKTLTSSAGTTTFVYDALGQMIEASGPSGTTLYVYDQAGHLLGEYDGSGNLIQETVWLGNIPVATLRPSGSSVAVDYVETDQLDTPRALIQSSSNALLWTWYAGPFGSGTPNENPSGFGTFTYDLRFPGQIAGAWGGTFQNTYRDYDPSIGRFVESDPIGLQGGINTYAYADDDPVDNVDPTGLLCFNFNKFVDYIRQNRLSLGGTLSTLSTTFAIGTMPKVPAELRGLGVPQSELNPYTSQLSRWSGRLDLPWLRTLGRTRAGIAASTAATAATIFEGFYDLSIEAQAAIHATSSSSCGCQQ